MDLVYKKDKEFHIHTTSENVGKYVILTGDPGRCDEIAKHLDNAILVASNREFVTYTGFLNGEKVSVASTGIGGPSAAIAIEELVNCGAHTFIRVGTCGGMNKDVCGGDLIIATGAIRFEGTTKEYVPIEFPAVANFDVISALKNSADKLNEKYHLGIIQSKDSFYGQHSPQNMPVSYELKNKWNAWMKCGALGSEMECASLFIVGSIRKVRVGAVLLTLANQTRRELGLEDNEYYDTEKAILVAINAMKNLINDSKHL